MDPLSATASALTLLDLANKIKRAIDKVSYNKRRLREISDDIVQGVSDLEHFCSSRAGVTIISVTESRELSSALKELYRDLSIVRDRCEKLSMERNATMLSSLRTTVKAWWGRDDIEADIIRLKERIQLCHSRFTTFSCARIEHDILVLQHEQREILPHLESSLSRILCNGCLPSRHNFTEGIELDDIEARFLQVQIKKIIKLLPQFKRSWTNMNQDHGGLRLEVNHDFTTFSLPSGQSKDSDTRRALIDALNLRQILESTDASSFSQCARALTHLGRWLYEIDPASHLSGILVSWAVDFYRVLNTSGCMAPYLAWALSTLAFVIPDSQLALRACRDAVAVRRTILVKNSDDHIALRLARSLHVCAIALRLHSFTEGSIEKSRQELYLRRQFLVDDYDPDGPVVVWDAYVGASPDFTPPQVQQRRLAFLAYEEACCLRQLALSLAESNAYTLAMIAAAEAVDCFRALLPTSFSADQENHIVELQTLSASWVPIFRAPNIVASQAWTGRSEHEAVPSS